MSHSEVKADIHNTTTQKSFFLSSVIAGIICSFSSQLGPIWTYHPSTSLKLFAMSASPHLMSLHFFASFPHTQKNQLFSILQYVNNASHLSVWLRHLLPCCQEGNYVLLQTSVIVFKILGFIPVLYMSESFAEL